MDAFHCRLQMNRPLTATVRIMLFACAFFAISLFSQRVAQGDAAFRQASKGQTIQIRQFAPLPAPFSAPRVRTPGPMQAALTFDDGPCRSRTRQTVNVLGDTVATFFVIGGQVRRSPSEAQYAASQGHSIQNHTMDHKRLNGLTTDQIFSQLDAASNFIENTIGIRPTVFRPPYGSTNSFVAETAASFGYSQIMWNGGAPRMESKRDEIINGVTGQANRAITNNRGLVLIFHDCSGNFGGMITALPDVIRILKNKGFEFVAIE
jgi:peptidoglycan/xylan/chitin deacetylase (PgdA/CDA1 family)